MAVDGVGVEGWIVVGGGSRCVAVGSEGVGIVVVAAVMVARSAVSGMASIFISSF